MRENEDEVIFEVITEFVLEMINSLIFRFRKHNEFLTENIRNSHLGITDWNCKH